MREIKKKTKIALKHYRIGSNIIIILLLSKYFFSFFHFFYYYFPMNQFFYKILMKDIEIRTPIFFTEQELKNRDVITQLLSDNSSVWNIEFSMNKLQIILKIIDGKNDINISIQCSTIVCNESLCETSLMKNNNVIYYNYLGYQNVQRFDSVEKLKEHLTTLIPQLRDDNLEEKENQYNERQ